jgi:hypothetical protein
MLRVAVLIDQPPTRAYHVATLAAGEHAAGALGIGATAGVLRTPRYRPMSATVN